VLVELHAATASAEFSRSYVRRTPEQGVLHRAVREHLQTFLWELDRHHEERGAPLFVKREFQRFVGCGVLAHGFARFRCAACGTDRLVAFSCKGRGFCPSCGGRRMTERAAHLIDHVLPRAPVRQWVLSLPFELRYRLAWDHKLCRAVLAVYTRALLGFYRKRARASGHRDGRTGTVTVIQRFGGALNLNVHFHTLVVDGVFVREPDGSLSFAAAKAPTDREVEALLGLIRKRVLRLLVRRGLLCEEGGESSDETEAPPLRALYAASVRQRIAVGRRADNEGGPAPAPPTGAPRRLRPSCQHLSPCQEPTQARAALPVSASAACRRRPLVIRAGWTGARPSQDAVARRDESHCPAAAGASRKARGSHSAPLCEPHRVSRRARAECQVAA
jgi:hypothetical protein